MIKKIIIKTALDTDNKMKSKIEAAVQKKLGAGEYSFEYQLDRELIGGIVIESDDFVLDGSLKAKLSAISSGLNK